MPEITITHPLRLELDVRDLIKGDVPAFRADVLLVAGAVRYRAALVFGYDQWEFFHYEVRALLENQTGEAQLTDWRGELTLRLHRAAGAFGLTVQIQQEAEASQLHLTADVELSPADLRHVAAEFVQFPIWWR